MYIMHLLFIDESGTIPPKNKSNCIEYFALGGVIIPESTWHTVNEELSLVKENYKISGEIKWRFFSPHNHNTTFNPFSHLTAQQKESMRLSLYCILNKYESIRSICIAVNIQKAYKLNYIIDDSTLYWFAYKNVITKFQNYLLNLSDLNNKSNGIIICDHRQPKDDYLLRILHQKLLTNDTGKSVRYTNLIEGVFLAPSHFSVGIQFADLVAGAIYRKFARNDDKYFNLIKPLIDRSYSKLINDCGLLIWPSEEDAVSVEPEPAVIEAVTAYE